MNNLYLVIATGIMALFTYLPRALPLVIFKKKIQSRFLQAFLLYMPFGVLAAMVFPGVFYSTDSLISAALGTLAALVLAFLKKGLLVVALAATITVFLTEQVLLLIK